MEKVKIQSVLVELSWKELAAQQEHIKHLCQLLSKQIRVKLPKNSAADFVKDLRECLSKDSPQDAFLTERQIAMINLLNQNNLIVIDAAKVIKKFLILLIQFCFSTDNLSMSDLSEVVFKVVKWLPEDLKMQCQKEMLSKSVNQLQMHYRLKEINPKSSVKNLFAVMVLEDYIEVDELILAALEQVQFKNIHIAKAMVEVLFTEYKRELRKKCNKPLNLKHLLDKLEDNGQPMENYNLNVFDEFCRKLLHTKWNFQLQNIIQENFEFIDEQKLCLAVHHFSSQLESDKNFVETVSLKFQAIQNEINDPECLRQFLKGMAMKKLQIDTKTQIAIFEQITKNISKFNAEQCQSILHKLVLLKIRDHKLCYLIVDQLCKKIDQIDTEALGKSIWSIGILGTCIDLNQKQCLEKKIYDLLDEIDERAITQIFYGLAYIFWQDNFLLNILCQKVNKLLKNSSTENQKLKLAVGVLGNLIKFNFYNESLYNIFSDIILDNVKSLQISDLVYFVSAFGFVQKTLVIENQQIQNLFQKVIDQNKYKFMQVNWLQLIQVFQSMAYTQFKLNIDEKLLDRYLYRLKKNKFFTIFQVADLICCVAKLHEKNLLKENQQELVSFYQGFIEKSTKKLNKEKEKEVSRALKILSVHQFQPQEFLIV